MSFFGNLSSESYDRSYSDRELIERIFQYFRPQRRRMGGVLVTLLVTSLTETVWPLAVAQGINALSHSFASTGMLRLVGLVLFSGILAWTVNLIRRRLTTRAIGDVVLHLRRDAFRAAAGHDLSFYDELKSGRIVSRITSDTQEFAQVVVLVSDLASQLLVVAILAVFLFRIEWRLALALVGMAPVVVLVASGFRDLARHVTRQGNRAMANVNAAIQETVSGIAVAKNFRQESATYTEFVSVNREAYRINVRRGFILSNVFPVLNALTGVGTAILVYFGGAIAAGGAISVGSWYLFIESLYRFWNPMTNIASFWSQFQGGLSAAERVFALVDTEPRVMQTAQRPVARLCGEIEFRNLCLLYSKQEVVLDDFSLHIRPGENVALVGHTGAGKSSVARLIARFYEFQGGQLLVDGQDIRTFDLREYRRRLGIVSQVPFLFSGSVADNIRYARPELSDAEIEALARRVGDGEWVDSLPDGLRTDVGERGGRLSMGQRQLVSLMRVLAQDPAVVILDEATASVDPYTESQIQDALDLILQGRTAIVIAHRLSTVQAADRIVVMRSGRIIEQGSHPELLARGGHYAELFNAYFRHQSPDAYPRTEVPSVRLSVSADEVRWH